MTVVILISLGGTITASAEDGGGAVPTASAGDLGHALVGVDLPAVEPIDLGRRASGELGIDDLHELVNVIERERGPGRLGTVVAIGSDALEEVAYGVDLLLQPGSPVVFTAAMRHRGLPGADGPANLADAVRVAADPAAVGLGTLVVLNGEVHAASLVRKSHTTALDAFESPNAGPLGWVREGAVRIVAEPRRPRPTLAPDRKVSAPVALLGCGIGDDGAVLRLLPDSGYRGAVVAGFGGGHVTPNYARAISAALASIPVVVGSRTGAGETLTDTYATSGCEIDLRRRGAILAGALDPPKARILLTLGLQSGLKRYELGDLFVAAAALPRLVPDNSSEGKVR